jgi:hypothetical protein
MQSVVRSSFVGLLAIASLTAGLTACGDKVTQISNNGDSVVHSVTVTPSAVPNLSVGGTFTLAASVVAGSGIKDRTVTWSTSDAAIASVDQNGKVTGVKAGGPVTITAASKVSPDVKGAAVVTVVPAGGNVPLVTISTINVTACDIFGGCTSVPANLLNVNGQVDVTVNVDASGQTLSKITGMIKCGNDSVQVVQNIAAGNVAAADEAAAPVTLNFNTAAFNPTTGVPALHNGQCTVSAFATTTGGQQSAVNSTSFTLNNADMAVVTVSSTNAATDPLNRPWIGGGPLTMTALPVMYSGRTPVAATLGITPGTMVEGATFPSTPSQTLTSLGTGGVFSVTWSNGPTAPSVQNFAARNITPFITISDNTGASTTNIGSITVKGGTTSNNNPTFNFDDQKPQPGTFAVQNNTDQNVFNNNAYIGSSFRFAADSNAGYRGPQAIAGNQTQNQDCIPTIAPPACSVGGVDKVSVVFQFRTNGSGTYAAVTNTSSIAESQTSQAYELRMITSDALGNADTTGTASSPQPTTLKFGVDKTVPTVSQQSGPLNQAVTTTAGGLGSYNFLIQDALSGTGLALVAQVRQWNGLTSATSFGGWAAALEGHTSTNVPAPVGATSWGGVGSLVAPATASPCLIGRFNAAQSAAGANAIPVLSASGTTLGFCTPVVFDMNAVGGNLPAVAAGDGYWYTTLVAADVAGNQAAPITRVVLQDQTVPTVTNIDPPPTATGNTTVAFPTNVTDNTGASVGDITASFIAQTFAGPGVTLRFANTAGPGTAFDNVLTNSSTANPSIPNFIKNLQIATTSAAPAAGNNATSVTVTALGAAGNGGALTYTFQPGAPQLVAGSNSTFSATGNCVVSGTGTCPSVSAWAIAAPANSNVTNCPADNCSPATATQPTSVTLTVTAQGLSQIYTNPFATGVVQFWYRPTGGTSWYLVGNSSAGLSRDNGTNRFWDYSVTFNPPDITPDGVGLTTAGSTIQVAAIGINAAGDAIMTAPITLTVANP